MWIPKLFCYIFGFMIRYIIFQKECLLQLVQSLTREYPGRVGLVWRTAERERGLEDHDHVAVHAAHHAVCCLMR